MATEQVSYCIEYICWAPAYTSDNKCIASDKVDDRTYVKKSFNTEEEARARIAFVKKHEGKWLAWIKLMRVVSTEIPIE